MNITPYAHKELTALVAEAWSLMEDQATSGNRMRAAKILRDVLIRMNPGADVPPMPSAKRDRSGEREMRRDGSRPVEILPVTARWFYSAADASNTLGIHRGGIVECLTGRQETAGGYRWRYSQFTTRHGFEESAA